MFRMIILLVLLYRLEAISESTSSTTCGPLCAKYCEYGNEIDKNGCSTCECRIPPQISNHRCKDGQASFDNYFCGRGLNSRQCPSTHYCSIAPNDAYAVCCPHSR